MNRITLRAVTLLCAIGVAAASLGLIASASHLEVADPNDTRGPLDVRMVRTGGERSPRWKIVTFSSWSRADIFDTGYVTVWLDVRGGTRSDYFILVGSMGNHLYAELWRDRAGKPDFKVANVKIWRRDRSSVSVKVPLRKMTIGERRTTYGWSVETIFTGERCRRVCFDNVPDEGAVTEPLPVPSPTPTVSPTVTITPSPSPTD